MTGKTINPNSPKVEKMPGWHSWRHQTRDAQDAARIAYLVRSGPAARRERAADRLRRNTEEG